MHFKLEPGMGLGWTEFRTIRRQRPNRRESSSKEGIMTRRLEGRKFFWNECNGVRAVVAEEVIHDTSRACWGETALLDKELEKGRGPKTEHCRAIVDGLSHMLVPVFTFANVDRAVKQPWFTGDEYLLGALTAWITAEGGECDKTHFYVPFANARELGDRGIEAVRDELKYATTETQFRETFGIGPREVEVWYAKKCAAEGVTAR